MPKPTVASPSSKAVRTAPLRACAVSASRMSPVLPWAAGAGVSDADAEADGAASAVLVVVGVGVGVLVPPASAMAAASMVARVRFWRAVVVSSCSG